MALELTTTGFLLAIMLGALLAIIYSLRILVILERRIARMEKHIEKVTIHILQEEKSIRRGLSKRKTR